MASWDVTEAGDVRRGPPPPLDEGRPPVSTPGKVAPRELCGRPLLIPPLLLRCDRCGSGESKAFFVKGGRPSPWRIRFRSSASLENDLRSSSSM